MPRRKPVVNPCPLRASGYHQWRGNPGVCACGAAWERQAAVVARRKERAGEAVEAAEALWGVVANVNNGDWSTQSEEWRQAARRARDLYHRALQGVALVGKEGGTRV